MHVDNDHGVFGLNRQFRVRRNRIFDLRERRPVLCSLTTNTYRKGKRIIHWSQPERVAERQLSRQRSTETTWKRSAACLAYPIGQKTAGSKQSTAEVGTGGGGTAGSKQSGRGRGAQALRCPLARPDRARDRRTETA